jgi:hypothetical protein
MDGVCHHAAPRFVPWFTEIFVRFDGFWLVDLSDLSQSEDRECGRVAGVEYDAGEVISKFEEEMVDGLALTILPPLAFGIATKRTQALN